MSPAQVEFVALDERATAFPSHGWLTRRHLEDTIPSIGPKALSEQQRIKQEVSRRAHEVGKRSEIAFAPARKRERERDERGEGERRYKDSLDRRDKVGRALVGMKGREGWSASASASGDKERGKGLGREGSQWDRR